MNTTNTGNKNWWSSFYDNLLADVLLEGTDESEIENTVNFISDKLQLSRGDTIFDQCCGTGRLLVPLAAKGFDVTGIDVIPGYVATARKKCDSTGLSANLEHADAFDFICETPCKAAVNWWTSFGYYPSDCENLPMLERASESLETGGKFALDFMNVPGVIQNFQPQVVTHGHSKSVGDIILIRESEIDVTRGLMNKDWTYILESGEKVEHQSSVRMYTPPDLVRLFEDAGFLNIEVYGDLDGSTITINSPRCIVIGQR